MAAAAAATRCAHAEPLPVKFAHRQANMVATPGPAVFELASRIPGLSGVELQMIFKGEDLSDRATALRYKRDANRWGLEIPSIAGVWKPHQSIFDTAAAEQTLRGAIQAAELLGSSVILVSQFRPNCPDMDKESSWGPVAQLFRKVAPAAADAGVTLGLETSLRPAEDLALLQHIGSPNVQVYFDATNVETNHPGEAVPGIGVLGRDHITQCHLKNEQRLLDQAPARVNWTEALHALRRIAYDGWFVFETAHSSPEQCITATLHNMAFVRTELQRAPATPPQA